MTTSIISERIPENNFQASSSTTSSSKSFSLLEHTTEVGKATFQQNSDSAKRYLVLFGPPGAGKGTFSQLAKEHYNYKHLCVGDLIREEIDQQTIIGKEAEECLQKGGLLPESTIQTFVDKHMAPLIASKKPFILDGFPRTQEGVCFIKDIFSRHDLNKQVLLIIFSAKDITCEERVLWRAICKKCSTVYNLQFCKPKIENQCDLCQSPLKIRSNDTKEIVKKRLEEHHKIAEKAYELAKSFFPSKTFDTDQPLETCLQNYRLFFDET